MSIRALVVDDSALYRKIVSDILDSIPEVQVVGRAQNGQEALRKCRELLPDLITLDLEMPLLDGLGVLQGLKEESHVPGVIMLSSLTTAGAKVTISALRLGALDFVVKPSGSDIDQNVVELRQELQPKVEAFMATRQSQVESAPSTQPIESVSSSDPLTTHHIAPQIVVIGISTGGPRALNEMLPALPADFPLPILIVQHMPPVFTKSLAEDLDKHCALTVREAEQDQAIIPGQVLIAPGGRHMRISAAGGSPRVLITDDPPVHSCRPAVDLLFESAASCYREAVLAVIMTGMGSDGTAGIKVLKKYNVPVIAQDKNSCTVFGMPRIPIEEGLADVVCPLSEIATQIQQLSRRTQLL